MYTAGMARLSNRDAYRSAMRVQRMVDDTITDMEESHTIAVLVEIRKKEPSQANMSILQVPDYNKSCIICPGITGSSLEIPSSLDQQSKSHKVSTELFFPLIFCGYSSGYGNTRVAFHRCQTVCISGVESLRKLGITDFPVYGLVTNGSKASIMMAWHSTKAITQSSGPKEARRNLLSVHTFMHAAY